jgi:hypothetical protein
MDEQAKINKDVVTKFEDMEKILKNLDGKVTEVGSSIREVFIVMKMLETQVDNLSGARWVTKESETTSRSRDGEGYSNSFRRDGGSH